MKLGISIIKNNMIMLSRNTPVALVVGAAGFIGSHLTEKLLEKNVQVLGLDNFSTGKSAFLEESSKNKNFHLFNQSVADNLEIDLPRLDYAFFVIAENINQTDYRAGLNNFIKFCAKFNPKIVYVSSIDLYDKRRAQLENLREAESFLANHSAGNQSNIRIVRISEIYGPRMHFRGNDPIVRLLKSAGLNNLQEEGSPLDFTTRAIFIDDAVNLLIKALMHGATAQKIYDGALLNPIKVAEIKQILLDPLWHENRNFIPTELPPWPTPNILKTEKELAWKPDTSTVSALRKTMHFLKENQESLGEEPENEFLPDPSAHSTNSGQASSGQEEKLIKEVVRKKGIKPPKMKEWKKKGSQKIGKYLLMGFGLAVIAYALFYPVIVFSRQAFEVKNYLQSSLNQVMKGDIAQAKAEVEMAGNGAQIFQKWVNHLYSLGRAGIFKSQLQFGEDSLEIINQGTKAVLFWIKGIEDLGLSMQVLSGSREGNLEEIYTNANVNLNQSGAVLSFIDQKLSDPDYQNNLPSYFQGRVKDLKKGVEDYRKLVENSKDLARILPGIFNKNSQSYLIVLTDNDHLRPGGGAPQAIAEISLDQGRLEEIRVDSVEALDKKLTEKIEIPVDLKKVLPAGDWKISGTNFETDNPANGKLFQWFYQKETGEKTAGVLTLDKNGLNEILKIVGPVTLPGKKQISEGNFLALSQGADSQFYQAVLKEVLNKIFFLSNQNYVRLMGSLGRIFEGKHALIYFSDPLLFSQVNSLGLTGVLPRQGSGKVGEKEEFLVLFETNLGEKKGFDLKKNLNLQSTIKENGEVGHKLQITYINQSGEGSAKLREQIYLPTGTKLDKATFAGKDILKEVSSYADFGRAVYSMFLEVGGKEEKNLILEYQDNKKLEFDAGVATINLEVIKQPGEQDNNFNYKLFYPQKFFLVSPTRDQNIPQEVSFAASLSKDLNFQVVLKK